MISSRCPGRTSHHSPSPARDLTLRRRDVHPAHVELGGEGARPLVEAQRQLAVHQVVVVDGGEPRAQTQLRALVAQVHGGRQRQVVVAGRVVGVLRGSEVKQRSRRGLKVAVFEDIESVKCFCG